MNSKIQKVAALAGLSAGIIGGGALSSPALAMTELAQGYALGATSAQSGTATPEQSSNLPEKASEKVKELRSKSEKSKDPLNKPDTDANKRLDKDKIKENLQKKPNADADTDKGLDKDKIKEKLKEKKKDKPIQASKQMEEGKCGEGKCGGAA